LVFPQQKIAVFCDGDFWHGRRWILRRAKLAKGHNANYWIAKIEANIARDKRHAASLRRNGWRVIRLWEGDIRTDPIGALKKVSLALKKPADH